MPRTQAARVLRAGAHSTLHGVVFAILCLGSAVYRRRGAALRPGHEIVSASRSRRIDPTPMHHALVHAHVGLLQPIYKRFLLGSDGYEKSTILSLRPGAPPPELTA